MAFAAEASSSRTAAIIRIIDDSFPAYDRGCLTGRNGVKPYASRRASFCHRHRGIDRSSTPAVASLPKTNSTPRPEPVDRRQNIDCALRGTYKLFVPVANSRPFKAGARLELKISETFATVHRSPWGEEIGRL